MEVKKVLLIKPSLYMTKELMEFLSFPIPLGLMYIAAYLEQIGCEVKIFDTLLEGCNSQELINENFTRIGLAKEKVIERIREIKPDLIGISNNFSAQFEATLEMAEICKRALPNVPLVVGGVHPSAVPADCVVHSFFDFVVVGEGEKTMAQIVNYLNGRIKKEELKSCYFKDLVDGSRVIFNGQDDLIENLDRLPLPAYHLVDMEAYFNATKFDATTRGGSSQRWASLITSRGCPYGCVFCSEHLVQRHKWRYHSPEYVAHHVKFLVDNYKVNNFSIDDGNFTLNLERAENILDLIKVFKPTLIFPNGVRADRMTVSLAKKLKAAGCRELTLAIEHGDQEFLNRVIGKSLNLSVAIENIKKLKKLKIPTTAFFIFGLPPENKKTLKSTITLIYKLARMGVVPNISLAMPLPGTDLTRNAIADGYLDHVPTPTELAMASSKHYQFINTPFSPNELSRKKQQVFLGAILLVVVFHFFTFLKFPLVQATFADLLSWQKIKKRWVKVKGLLQYN